MVVGVESEPVFPDWTTECLCLDACSSNFLVTCRSSSFSMSFSSSCRAIVELCVLKFCVWLGFW